MSLVTSEIRSAENLVTELFSIIDGCRWDDLPGVFAPDCVYDRPGYEPLIGLARIQLFYREERVIGSGSHHVLHVVSNLEAAACWGRFTGVSKIGHPLDEEFADTYTVRNSRIVHRQTYFYRPAI
ncbi:nuclear transport factor 2 family protein [Streptomyces sp. NBC_01262]|uniref:nuclear transport factor 2 family protein n=1 Tax=Streptomyces sp. NBC_01262 TaxID=2903803 RepID=UPI002E316131|nr:nuclear transport factor 2 family protein [Streptomyces sp. NBC_01262]